MSRSPRPRFPSFARAALVAVLAVGVSAVLTPATTAATTGAPAASPASAASGPIAASAVGDSLLKPLKWRLVGPFRGGRAAAVAGVASQPETYYFGSAGGGVWKTTDGGGSWANVSDGSFGGSIGAVAVSAWDPNVVYVGTGESTVRGNVSEGDGMWKSTDAGRTWKHVGLEDSRHIVRIRIHPKNPDLVYAAVLGHLFGPSEERGVYRSEDGGKTWQRILFVSKEAGAIDLAMDPTNPRILYATFWQVDRKPWTFDSGGPGSGLWKSTDGGDTWQELTHNEGLPKGIWGRAGITVSRSNPDNLYAIVEAEKGGVFRSQDGGKTWHPASSDHKLTQRAWYYSRIFADPADEESVYVVNVRFQHSKDGGKTFEAIRTPHGDNHDLWIAPADPKRMIEANDGGVNVTTDGGVTWSTEDNQPTAQFYRVSTDNAFPYRILGAQQDNSALRIRSRSTHGGSIGERDWEPTAGGESGYILAKPDDPDVIYGGSYGDLLVRIDHATGEVRAVNVWPDDPMGAAAADIKYRFQWNYPMFFSPHDPNELYAAAQMLFRSHDGGQSWQKISPDLTRADPKTLGPAGGPLTKDNTSVEYYATIFAAAESPVQKGVLWAGSDDGLLHVSRDDGATWTDVTPKWPEWMQVNEVEPSPFEAGGLYVAGTRYKLDDFHPYLYKTSDYGKTWTRITTGIPDDHFSRVVRADPERRGLLYAGTEDGMYVSFDDGASWRPLQLNLPITPVTDLTIKDGDLVAATQGRAFWVLDDLSPLRDLTAAEAASVPPEAAAKADAKEAKEAKKGGRRSGSKSAPAPQTAAAEPALLAPRPAMRLQGGRSFGEPEDAGANPPTGLALYYVLPEEPAKDTKLQIDLLQPDGKVIRSFVRKPAPGEKSDKDKAKDGDDEEGGRAARKELPELTADRGLNRVVWDLTYPGAESFPGMVLWNRNLAGPVAVPGDYKARLTVGDWSGEVPFQVVPDPRSSATPEDYRAQFDFVAQVRDELTRTNRAIRRIRAATDQLATLKKRLEKQDQAPDVRKAIDDLSKKLTDVEETLYQTKSHASEDPLNFPIRLNDKLANVLGLARLGDFRPTDSMVQVRGELEGKIDAQLETLDGLWKDGLSEVNRLAAQAGVPAVIVEAPKSDE